jgi:hypothetical protein
MKNHPEIPEVPGLGGTPYDLPSIPYAFLLDGDTGLILAAGESLRGTNLIPTIEKALASKHGK